MSFNFFNRFRQRRTTQWTPSRLIYFNNLDFRFSFFSLNRCFSISRTIHSLQEPCIFKSSISFNILSSATPFEILQSSCFTNFLTSFDFFTRFINTFHEDFCFEIFAFICWTSFSIKTPNVTIDRKSLILNNITIVTEIVTRTV